MGGIAMFFALTLAVAGTRVLIGMTEGGLSSNTKVTMNADGTKDVKAAPPPQPAPPPPPPTREHWAVVVAGSRRYWNYRHQSDVCHAYQLLKARGFDDDHVITMVYDDIANNYWQSREFYGKIFNRPGGPDVYKGCAKDYTGTDVSAENFYKVLSGDKKGMEGVGSGRVVESTENDDIFFFFSDHGSVGLVGMPAGSYIWADEFNKVVEKMAKDKKFYEMVIYMESCEAGSMFEGLLKKDIGVYALSAANATESSWATYCSDSDLSITPRPSQIGTCMGDLFSTKWMEDSEHFNPLNETLHEQFIKVARETGREANHGYGSAVLQYGEIKIDNETVANFMVDEDPEKVKAEFEGDPLTDHEFLSKFNHKIERDDPLVRFANYLPGTNQHVDQRDADMVFFMQRASTTNDLEEQDVMLSELRNSLVARRKVDMDIRAVVGGLLQMRNSEKHPLPNHMGAAVERMVSHHMGRPGSGKPAVDDFDCLRGMMSHWEEQCGRVTDYSMKYSRTFANLCNEGISVEDFAASVANVCGGRGGRVEKEAEDYLQTHQSHEPSQRIVVS
ncbi:hypothetical protein BSKO_03991 [Bryopsis sp. KO-2023]|nr:hypothetical protein BSKO_03991 [Bryopsis sp. KO-2023]